MHGLPSQSLLPLALFPLVVAAVIALARRGDAMRLICLDLFFVLFPGGWVIAGIMVNPTDLVLAGIASIFLRRKVNLQAQVPMYRLWILLGVLQSLAYVHAPMNHEYLTDPLRAGYQLYRYCWKPILYYPICAVLLDEKRNLSRILLCLLLVLDGAAVQGILQGYEGARASGPFDGTNTLGGVLVTPFLITGLLLLRRVSGARVLCAISMVIMARAMIFSGSRGAFVAVIVAGLVCAAYLWTTARGRGQVGRVLAIAVPLVTLVIAVRPEVLQGPNVQRLASVSGGTDVDNFRWRLERRWPHFTKKVLENPLFGVGTEVDPALGRWVNTPHNGYLALALVHGIPAAAIFVFFGLVALRTGLRRFRRAEDLWERTFGLGVAASILGLFVHNVVDATFLMPFVASLFWMLVAVMLTARRREAAPVAAPARVRPSRTLRGGTRGRLSARGVRLGGRT